MSNFALAFLICSALSFGFFYYFSIRNYQNKFKMTYHFRNCFPYELNFHLQFKDNLLGNTCFLLYAIFNILFFVFFDSLHVNGFLIAAQIIGILLSIFELLTVFIPLDKLRFHLFNTTFLFVLSLLLNGSIIGAGFVYYEFMNEIFYIFIIVFAAIIFLIQFALLMHPKLLHWAEMDKKINEDGTSEIVRPKIFILAFYEWIFMFLTFGSEILLLIINFLK